MGKKGSLGGVPARAWPQKVWSVVELGSYVLGKAQPHHLSTYGPPSRPHHLSSTVSTSSTLAGARWNTLSPPRWPSSAHHLSVSLSLPCTEVTPGEQGRARLFSIGHLPALTGLTGVLVPSRCRAIQDRWARPTETTTKCDWLESRGPLPWLSADSLSCIGAHLAAIPLAVEMALIMHAWFVILAANSEEFGTLMRSSTSFPHTTARWWCAHGC